MSDQSKIEDIIRKRLGRSINSAPTVSLTASKLAAEIISAVDSFVGGYTEDQSTLRAEREEASRE